MTKVFAADTVEGWADRFKTDENGRVYVDETGEAPACERLYGDAAVLWVEGREPAQ